MDGTPQQPPYHSENADPTAGKAVAAEDPISLTTLELDMLIRSGTSLLSIVHPQQDHRRNLAKKDGDYRTLVRLDRIATLFVTKDKAAVSAVMVKQNVNVTCIYVIEREEPYAGIWLRPLVPHDLGKSYFSSGVFSSWCSYYFLSLFLCTQVASCLFLPGNDSCPLLSTCGWFHTRWTDVRPGVDSFLWCI